MSRKTLVLALVGLSSLAACGGGAPQDVKSPENGSAPEAKAETKPEGSAAPKSEAPKDDKAEKKDDKAAKKDDNTFKGDDPGKTVKLTGPKAWTLGPGESWAIGLYDYVRADGTKNVFKEFGGEGEFAIPGAFTYQAPPAKGLKKGDPVYVTVVTDGECGRVISVSDTEIKVAFMWAGKRDERTYEPAEVLPFDGKLGYGAPVAYKEDADAEGWWPGHLVYMDDKNAWLEGDHKAPRAQVKPLDVKKTYKAGDKVLVVPNNTWGTLRPATITKVLNDGLEYEYKDEDGEKAVAPYCQVTAPLK